MEPIRTRVRQRPGRQPVTVMYVYGHERTVRSCDPEIVKRELAAFVQEVLGGASERPGGAPAAPGSIADIIREHREVWVGNPTSEREQRLRAVEDRLLPFWGELTLADANPRTSAAYARQRWDRTNLKEKRLVGPSPIRRELGHLALVLRLHCERHGIAARPNLPQPERAEGRTEWLGRDDVARLLHAARGRHWDAEADDWARDPATGVVLLRDRRSIDSTRALARLILIGAFTGTRSEAMCTLRWRQGPNHGHVDVGRGVIHRRGRAQVETKKRRPVARICNELMRLVRRWAQADAEAGRDRVVSLGSGGEMKNPEVIFRKIRDDAGFGPEVTIHVLRHTCANWLIEGGADLVDVGAYLGLSVQELERTYVQWDEAFSVAAADALADWGRPAGWRRPARSIGPPTPG